jgi:hypothetical protein
MAANNSARIIQRSIDELLQHDPLNINGNDYYLPENKKEHAYPSVDAPFKGGKMPEHMKCSSGRIWRFLYPKLAIKHPVIEKTPDLVENLSHPHKF